MFGIRIGTGFDEVLSKKGVITKQIQKLPTDRIFFDEKFLN